MNPNPTQTFKLFSLKIGLKLNAVFDSLQHINK